MEGWKALRAARPRARDFAICVTPCQKATDRDCVAYCLNELHVHVRRWAVSSKTAGLMLIERCESMFFSPTPKAPVVSITAVKRYRPWAAAKSLYLSSYSVSRAAAAASGICADRRTREGRSLHVTEPSINADCPIWGKLRTSISG